MYSRTGRQRIQVVQTHRDPEVRLASSGRLTQHTYCRIGTRTCKGYCTFNMHVHLPLQPRTSHLSCYHKDDDRD